MSFELHLNSDTVNHCHPTQPVCMAPTASGAEAMREMRRQSRGAVLVCDNDVVIGIFTERDALKRMAAGASFDAPLSQLMIANPVVLRADDTVGKAIAMMARGGYRRLPIVDIRGRAIGMITVQSIMHYLVEHFPSTIYNLPPEPHHTTQMREGA